MIPSTPIAITSSKNFATRSGSAPSNRVQLMLTRKPRRFASLMAATARSKVPAWLTERSCISRSPSRCTSQEKSGCGLYWSIFFSSSSALVQR